MDYFSNTVVYVIAPVQQFCKLFLLLDHPKNQKQYNYTNIVIVMVTMLIYMKFDKYKFVFDAFVFILFTCQIS